MNKPPTAREAKLKGEQWADYVIDREKGITAGDILAAKASINEREAAEVRVGIHTLFELFDRIDGNIKCILPSGDEVALNDILLLFKHTNHDLLTEVRTELGEYGIDLVNSTSGETIFGFSFEMF
jgi:hypothetical protein